MKVLIDECAPKALKRALVASGHQPLTVQEAGWSGKKNGELLKLAETRFDALITLDTNLEYQQDLVGRKISIVVIRSRSNRVKDLSPYFSACVSALEDIQPGEVVFVDVVPRLASLKNYK